MADRLLPQHNYVLLRPLKDLEEKRGDIVITSAKPKKSARGIVEAVGPEADKRFQPGQEVLFPPFIGLQEDSAAFEYRLDGVELLFLLDESILAVVGDWELERDGCTVCGCTGAAERKLAELAGVKELRHE